MKNTPVVFFILRTRCSTNIYGRSLAEWNKKYSQKNELLKRLPSEVLVYDPVEDFCDQQQCYVVKDKEALYFDHSHPSLAGTRLMSEGIMKLIKE